MYRSGGYGSAAALVAALMMWAGPGSAQIAVSSNDNHTVLVNGVQVAAKNPLPDTVSVIDLAHYPPRIISTVEAPGSVVGPPMAVAVARDESYAIVTAATKLDSADTSKIVPDNRISVIDLKASPPKVVQQLTAGRLHSALDRLRDGHVTLGKAEVPRILDSFCCLVMTCAHAGYLFCWVS